MSASGCTTDLPPSEPPRRVVGVALGLEGGLAAAAIFIGWLVGHSPLRTLVAGDSPWAIAGECGWGLAATVPLVVALVVLDRYPAGPIAGLRRQVQHLVELLFRGCRLWHVAAVSLAAGVGEELLFRGLVQDGLAQWLGPPYGAVVGLAAASLLFGLAHFLSRTYALVATAMGAYLGAVFLLTGSLLAVIVVHAAYDFAAIVYFLHAARGRPPAQEKSGPALDAPDRL